MWHIMASQTYTIFGSDIDFLTAKHQDISSTSTVPSSFHLHEQTIMQPVSWFKHFHSENSALNCTLLFQGAMS